MTYTNKIFYILDKKYNLKLILILLLTLIMTLLELFSMPKVGVNKNRALCANYLKIFERFDAKKSAALDKLIEITYE